MKKLGVSILIAVAIALPLVLARHAVARSQAANETLRAQLSLAQSFVAGNQRLSNAVAQTARDLPSPAQSRELAKLRNEAGQLRAALQEMEKLKRQNDQFATRWQNVSNELDEGPESATALMADVMDRHRARVAQLKQWMEQNPEQKIPELQSLRDLQWIATVEQPLVTDEDFLDMASFLRSDAQYPFLDVALKAVKAYAQANNGQFPGDLSQLQPYFSTPVPDAVLQRYEIVPANTLSASLAVDGSDWVITQKAPINPQMDMRSAIGATNWVSAVSSQGVWDPPH
jgi:hypothetical protein